MPPMASNHFKPAQALKRTPSASSVPTQATEPAVVTPPKRTHNEDCGPPSAPNPYRFLQPGHYPPPMPFPFMPMMSPYGMPMNMFPNWDSSPTSIPSKRRRGNASTSRYTIEDARSSSPPPDADLTATDFCEQAELNPEWAARLDELGFSLSADLDQLSREDWLQVGFKPLEWVKVTKAYKKLRHQLKSKYE